MTVYATENIRNIAVVGHSDTGKTSLVSALLFDSGAINRLCKVDDANTTTDFDDDEHDRKITINTAVAFIEHRGVKVNLIDTPGYGIFSTDAMQGLRVADAALMMVSAVAGVEVQTEKMWKSAASFDLPVFFAVNLMDRDRASYSRVVEALQKKYGRAVTPLQLPIGQESSFSGVVDLVSGKAFTWEHDESGKVAEADVPDDMADDVAAAREALMEMVAEQDEELMEKYLEEGELDGETLSGGLKKAITARELFPVFALAAAKNIGVQPLMDAMVDLAPTPDWRPVKVTVDGEEQEFSVSSDSPFAAYVFKSISDPFAGHITLMRVFSGGIATDANVSNSSRDSAERLSSMSIAQGKDLEHVTELAAGDIGALPKLKETHTGDTLCEAKQNIKLTPVAIPEPAISFALEAESKGDENKLASALVKIRDEDPTITIGRDPQTKEMLISGAGQLHVEVVVGRLKKRYNVNVVLHQPKVPPPATRSRPAARASSPSARSKWSPTTARATSSSTRSSAGRFRRPTGQRWTRASGRPRNAASSPATRWWTSRSLYSMAKSTRWIRRRWRSSLPGARPSGKPPPNARRLSSSRSCRSKSTFPRIISATSWAISTRAVAGSRAWIPMPVPRPSKRRCRWPRC
jgi:elongation factor G